MGCNCNIKDLLLKQVVGITDKRCLNCGTIAGNALHICAVTLAGAFFFDFARTTS